MDALADLFEDLAGDLLLCRRELQIVEEGLCAAAMVRAEASQMFWSLMQDGAGFGAEALAAAVGAEA